MKFITYPVALTIIGILMFTSCSKPSGNSVPAPVTTNYYYSSFNINFPSKTMNETVVTPHGINNSSYATVNTITNSNVISVAEISFYNGKLGVEVAAYQTTLDPLNYYVVGKLGVQVIDYTDNNKIYIPDSSSTVQITTANANEVKGTFNLNLYYHDTLYVSTGNFDINNGF